MRRVVAWCFAGPLIPVFLVAQAVTELTGTALLAIDRWSAEREKGRKG